MITFNICGRVTRDPEQTGNGPVKFSIAVDQGLGQNKRGVFYDCTAWGKTGERVLNGWTKGKPMLATGRVEQDEWTDKTTGQKRQKVFLVVESAHFVPSDASARGNREPAPEQVDRGFDDGDSSIPF